MTSAGFRGALRALGAALRRGILGKSDPEYMKQFTGGSDYWKNVIAADSSRWVAPPVRARVSGRPVPEFEPVHGWTSHQLKDFLEHNPGYASTYYAELQKCLDVRASQANGTSRK